MKIYHGSKKIIESPKVKGSDSTNDYGPSFYLSLDLNAAKSWACKNDVLGVVSEYECDTKKFKKLKILDLTNKNKFTVLNWIAILMHYRELDTNFVEKNKSVLDWLSKYYIDVDEYDVIIGYRADDSYFRFPIRFVSNDLAFEDLEEVFMLGHLGIQYAFMSKKAIDLLVFNKSIECEPSFIGHYYSVVTKASKEFNAVLNRPRDINKHYILDLMREDHE